MLGAATVQALDAHGEFYVRAASFDGRPRERMVALEVADELFFRLYPQHYRALQVVRVAAQLGKATHRRRGPLQRCESRTVGLLDRVLHDAIDCGDLELPATLRPGEVAFSVWALVFGTRALMHTAAATRQLAVDDAFAVTHETVAMLFDALSWRPLTCAWDYTRTRERVRREIFGAEWPQSPAA